MKTHYPPFVHSFPAPVVLIGCGTVEEPNLITCSWFGTVCSEPPMVSVSIRASRYSYHLIHESREFTVNLPRASDLPSVVHCGTVSGRTARKFDDLHLTPVPCSPLQKAPMIAEFFQSLACRVKHELQLGTHHIFIADVLAVHGEPREDRVSARPATRSEQQIVYLEGKYWGLTLLDTKGFSVADVRNIEA